MIKRFLIKAWYSLIVLVVAVASMLVFGTIACMKTVKEYAGEMVCTTYHVSDNTPRGTRATSTGHRATEYHTIAVDANNPRFPIGTKLYVKGFGYGVVEDVGGFHRYGVSLDLFTPENIGFKKPCKVWVIREETPKEKRIRRKKERKARQDELFTLVPGDTPVGTVVADPKILKKGSTIQIGYSYYEVVENADIGNAIMVGGLGSVRAGVQLEYVTEVAVG